MGSTEHLDTILHQSRGLKSILNVSSWFGKSPTSCPPPLDSRSQPGTVPVPSYYQEDLCAQLPSPLRQGGQFTDWDMLECGEAREFIPAECLNPLGSWCQCRLMRHAKTHFSLFEDGKGGKFLLSAKVVGNDFFISQYENFPTDMCPDRDAPTSKFCAVLRHRGRQGRSDVFELVPFVLGACEILRVSHSWHRPKGAGAPVRKVVVRAPDRAAILGSTYMWDFSSCDGVVGVGPTSSSRHGPRPESHTLHSNYTVFETQCPRWDPVDKCLVMKFQDRRVKESSSKNFILHRRTDLSADGKKKSKEAKAQLQFGKVRRGLYALDFSESITPLEAFAISLSSFACKPNPL